MGILNASLGQSTFVPFRLVHSIFIVIFLKIKPAVNLLWDSVECQDRQDIMFTQHPTWRDSDGLAMGREEVKEFIENG